VVKKPAWDAHERKVAAAMHWLCPRLTIFLKSGTFPAIMREYKTSGTCSTAIHFDVKGGNVRSVSFDNGCDGNLKAIGILVEGMEAASVVEKLKGLRCGRRETSCGDQLARAIEKALATP